MGDKPSRLRQGDFRKVEIEDLLKGELLYSSSPESIPDAAMK